MGYRSLVGIQLNLYLSTMRLGERVSVISKMPQLRAVAGYPPIGARSPTAWCDVLKYSGHPGGLPGCAWSYISVSIQRRRQGKWARWPPPTNSWYGVSGRYACLRYAAGCLPRWDFRGYCQLMRIIRLLGTRPPRESPPPRKSGDSPRGR